MSLKPENEKASDEKATVDGVNTLLRKLYIEKRTHRKYKSVQNPFRNKCAKTKKISINYTSKQCKEMMTTLKTNPCDINKNETKLISDITEGIAKVWGNSGYRGETRTKATRSRRKPKEVQQQSSISESESSALCKQTCARQALYDYCDSSVTELAAYLDETLYIPRKMSFMAEMMYT